MTIAIHGHIFSTCTKRVAIVCKQLGVDYNVVTVDVMKGAHKTPEFLALQPFGQIPALVDDDFTVFESRAISRYIAAKYGKGSSLYPRGDLKKEALFEQAASIEQNNFDPSASGIVVERVFKKFRGLESDEKHVAELEGKLKEKLKGYETLLSKHKYLAGDDLTIADLFHLPYGQLVTDAGVTLLTSGEYPNVTRWWKEISTLPNWLELKDKRE